MPEFKVAILCMTYQQASYIKDALDGFCMQQTTFPFIAAVVDDASTDGEQNVINQYVKQHFDLDSNEVYVHDAEEGVYVYAQHKTNKNCYILSLNLKKNLFQQRGAKSKLISKWTEKAKYRAECEGDDYWLEPFKLQKQYDALEKYETIDLCACGAIAFDKKNKELFRIQPYKEETIIPADNVILGGGNYLATNSLMYRSSLIVNNTYKFWESYKIDYFYQILGSLRGGIYFIPQCMAAYRYMAGNSWTNAISKDVDRFFDHENKVVHSLCVLDLETDYKYTESINKVKKQNYFLLFRNGIMGSRMNEIISKLTFKNKIALMWRLFRKLFL